MNEESQLEYEVLKYIADWTSDPDGPGGDSPILEPDTLSLIPSLKTQKNDVAQRNWRRLEIKVRDLSDRNLIISPAHNEPVRTVRLSALGHARLVELESTVQAEKAPVRAFFAKAVSDVRQGTYLAVVAAIVAALVLTFSGVLDRFFQFVYEHDPFR